MSQRLATKVGLVPEESRTADTRDLVRINEPTVGAPVRTKGSLYLVAQLTNAGSGTVRAARQALESIEHDYYYDLSAGPMDTLARALAQANRRLYHGRGRAGLGRGAQLSIVAAAIRGSELHVAKIGPAGAIIVRGDRIYELPPPHAAEDDRGSGRRVAESLGEVLEIEPVTWSGELAHGDRLALVSRNFAEIIGAEDMRSTLLRLRPGAAARELHQTFLDRGGSGSDGLITFELNAISLTATTHRLEPVRPADPLAGLPDRSPVPGADAVGGALRRADRAVDSAQSRVGSSLDLWIGRALSFMPRRRVEYPHQVVPTEAVEARRRHRLGALGMVGVAALLAAGVTVASYPSVDPTQALPRLAVAREAIAEGEDLIATVEARVDGLDLVERDPERAKDLLADAGRAIDRAEGAGVPAASLEPLRVRLDARLDALYRVTRIRELATVADLATAFTGVDPQRMVAASDGSLWVLDGGRGRIIRVDTLTGAAEAVYRAGQTLDGVVAGDPWLLATAATDIVIVDRDRQAWRADLVERVMRRMPLAGIEALDSGSELFTALQHLPPLEIFNLYAVDGAAGTVWKWTPPAVIPVTFPDPPESFLTGEPDLDPATARDLRADANLWFLHRATVTRVNFGTPVPQEDFSLDRPPDAAVREALDYTLFDAATIGDRDQFFVYDAANARIVAFQRADGAFVRQWMAPRRGDSAGLLDEILGMDVVSVADGPPVAYLLLPDRVVRVVLE
ncbi:MAG TPA: hypothetical protein VIA02_07045 [Candidatus Limnocylindria bacterium]